MFDCQTADDVRALARSVYLKRKMAFAPKPVHSGAPPRQLRDVMQFAEPEKAAQADPAPVDTQEPDCAARPPRLAEIISATSKAHCVSCNDLLSSRRSARICVARHACMWVMKTYTRKSFPEMGRALGWRDHSTVIHGYRKMRRLRITDPQAFDAIVIPILRELGLPLLPAETGGG